MLNQSILVGRIVREPEVRETENGVKISNITLAVPRSYKNENGEYETDFIDCTLWDDVAKNTSEYCKKGDLIGIRGRLETNVYETDKVDKVKKSYVVVERLSFLSSKTKQIDDSEPEME